MGIPSNPQGQAESWSEDQPAETLFGAENLTLADFVERHRVQAALDASEFSYRDMIDALPAAVYTTDAQGRLTHFNHACVELSGRTPELGTDSWCVTWKLFYPDGRPMPHDECPMAIALKEGRSSRGAEAIAERPDGTRVWFAPYPTPLLDDAGQVIGGINMLFDITERKHHEANLAILAEVSQDLAHLTNIDETLAALGERIAAHFNLSACAFAEIDEVGMVVVDHDWHRSDVPSLRGRYRVQDFMTPELVQTWRAGDAVVVRDAFADTRVDGDKYAALGISAFIGMPLVRKGQWRYLLAAYRSEPHDWRDDEIALLRELADRIWTRLERIRAEQALAESEEKFRALFNSMDQGYCIIKVIFDDDGRPYDWRFEEVNPAFEKNNGISNACGKTILELTPDIEPKWFDIYGRVARTGEPRRFEEESPALKRRFSLYVFRVGAPEEHRVAVLFTDITAQDRAAKQLGQSEERLRLAQIAGHIGTTDYDVSTDRMHCSPEFHVIYGLPFDADVTLATLLDTVHPEDVESVAAGLRMSIREGTPFADEFRIYRANDGQQRWIAKRAISIMVQGKPGRLVGTNVDVTERRHAEDALRESEERIQQALDAGAMGTFVWHPEDDQITDNGVFELLGLEAGAKLSMNDILRDWVHADDSDRCAQALARACDPAGDGMFKEDIRFVRRDGETRWLAIHGQADFNADPPHECSVSGVAVDVSTEKRAEANLLNLNEHLEDRIVERTRELAESEKRVRATASKLARAEQAERRRISQILHDDLQQQLHGMQMKLGMMRRRVNNGDLDGAMASLDEVERWAGEGVQIARQLTTDLSPPIMKSEGLVETLGWLVAEMREKHGLAVEVTGDQGVDLADDDLRVQLFQIVRELLFNIVKHADTDQARIDVERPAGGVMLRVSDGGRGFAADAGVEPKKDGGFGLFSVRERLALFGADMHIDSTPGSGTCITIKVPPNEVQDLAGEQDFQRE